MNRILKAVLVLSIIASGAYASDWTGAVNNDWNTAGNWTAGVPNADWAYIVGAYTVNVDATPASSATRIYLSGGGTVNLNTGNLVANYSGGWWDNGAFTIGRDNGGAGTFNMSGGTVDVTGNVSIGEWGATGNWNQTAGTANVSGAWQVGSYHDVQANNTYGNATVSNATVNANQVYVARGHNNTAQIQAQLDVDNGGVINSEGDLFVSFAGAGNMNGTMNINNGGVVNVGSTIQRWMIMSYWDTCNSEVNINAGGTLNLNGGTDLQVGLNGSGNANLTVAGTINGSVADGVGGDDTIVRVRTSNSSLTLAGGLINADVSVQAAGATIGGTGTIDGNLDLASGALLAFSETDTLTVSGTLTLDSTFGVDDLVVADWSAITPGTYTLIDNAGDFSHIENFGINNHYTDPATGVWAYFENGSLALTVVPEPGTIGLLGAFGAGILFIRRRFMI